MKFNIFEQEKANTSVNFFRDLPELTNESRSLYPTAEGMKLDLYQQEQANKSLKGFMSAKYADIGPSTQIIFEFTKRLKDLQKKLPPEYAKIIQEDFGDLL